MQLAALLLGTLQATQVAPADLSAQLEPLLERFDVPALAGAVVTADEGLVALGAAGVRRRGSDAEVALDDRWHLGSCAKAMTATLAATFVTGEEGLSWSSALGDVYDGEALHAGWRTATLEQLLSHTAGMPNGLAVQGALGLRVRTLESDPAEQRRTLVAELLAAAPPDPPGSLYRYSNEGYVVAADVLRRTSGEDYRALLTTRLFEPLDMASAGFGPPGTKDLLDQPVGHTVKGKPIGHGPFADNPTVYDPAGRVHATLADWASFVRLHLRGARGDEGLLLPPAAFAELHRARPRTEGPYALGWIVTRRPWGGAGPVLTHAGSNTYWFCVVWISLEREFAVLAATNQGGDTAARACDALSALLIGRHLEGTRSR